MKTHPAGAELVRGSEPERTIGIEEAKRVAERIGEQRFAAAAATGMSPEEVRQIMAAPPRA